MTFEYKVVPAPRRGKKAKGAKSGAQRFALALSQAMNAEAAEGWEYLRTDTLPAEERHGLSGRKTVFQHMLVFRRAIGETAAVAPMAKADGANGAELPPVSAPGPDTGNAAPRLPSAEAAKHPAETGSAPALGAADQRDLAAE